MRALTSGVVGYLGRRAMHFAKKVNKVLATDNFFSTRLFSQYPDFFVLTILARVCKNCRNYYFSAPSLFWLSFVS